jgi:hypothetical protein
MPYAKILMLLCALSIILLFSKSIWWSWNQAWLQAMVKFLMCSFFSFWWWFCLRSRRYLLDSSELKQATFLTTRTAWVTLKDWVENVDWLITSNLLPVNVRVVKNVAWLSSLVTEANGIIGYIAASWVRRPKRAAIYPIMPVGLSNYLL